MKRLVLLTLGALALNACANNAPPPAPPAATNAYLDNSGRDDVLTGGVKMIPITTPKGTFKVWTKRVGNSPTMKVLLLHGGPGATHEYLEACDSYLPAAGSGFPAPGPLPGAVARSASSANLRWVASNCSAKS